jgi:hypothetical protein
MHSARTCCNTQTKQANKVEHVKNAVYKQMLAGAYRADVCINISEAHLCDHLAAESVHMP